MSRVDNAVIMAAGTSSRFAPLSYERPKALITVRGEVLIERQIRQLKDAGIQDVIVVTGYKSDQFDYLKGKFGVTLIENRDYLTRNNNSTIHAVKEHLGNSYICSSDNYFSSNPFEADVDGAYYAAIYAEGKTDEWCLAEDQSGYISSVTIGGSNSWYMMGHAFWDSDFSSKFINILDEIYDRPETAGLLWESIFMQHLDQLKMKVRHYPDNSIFEFDTLDELRTFDSSYVDDTRSEILKMLASRLGCKERDIVNVTAYKTENFAASGFLFDACGNHYRYCYDGTLEKEER